MYVHVPIEVIEERPWVGVLIGVVGLALMGFLTLGMWQEYQRLSWQREPERIGPDKAQLAATAQRRWIVLEGGEWDCAHLAQTKRVPPESWLFGRVDTTQVPVWDETHSTLVVVKFSGDVPCVPLTPKAIEGVLVREGDRLWGGSVALELVAAKPGNGLVVLCAGAGPGKALGYTVAGIAMMGASAFLVWLFSAKMRARARRASTFSESAPVEPA